MKLIRSIAMFSAMSLFAFATLADEYENRIGEIEKLVDRQDWEAADSLIVETMRSDPSNPGNILLLSNLGMIRFYEGKDSLALSALDQAHAMAPNSVSILANRARVHSAIGNAAAAIADYNEIEKLDSVYVDTYINRGVIYLYSGLFELAERDLLKANSIAPTREDTQIGLASLYSITSRPEQALEPYSRLIRSHKSAEYYAGRAMCLLELDRLPEAAEDIASGLELDDGYSELYLARAILNKKRYESDASLRDATRAIELGANRSRVKMMLGL